MRICGYEISGVEVVYKKLTGKIYQQKKTGKGGRPLSRFRIKYKYKSKTLENLVKLHRLLNNNNLEAKNFERRVLVRLAMKHLGISRQTAYNIVNALTTIQGWKA